MTGFCLCPRKSAAPVGNRVEKAQDMYPSVVNSLIGVPPIVGHMRTNWLEEKADLTEQSNG